MIRFTGVSGNAIAGDIAGDVDGDAVVLLHGGGQRRQSWHAAYEALADRGYLTISLDARGHGDSAWTTDGYTLDKMAGDLRNIIDRLGRPVALIGASMGGLAALTAFSQDPALNCYALALIDVVPRINDAGAAHILRFMGANPTGFATLDEAADAVAAYLPNRKRPASSKGLQKNLRLRENGRYYWHWDPAFLEFRTRDSSLVDELEKVVSRLVVPTTLIRGGQSNVVTQAEAERFRRLMPTAEIVDIAGAAHMVAGDQNDVFLNAIESFLERATSH